MEAGSSPLSVESFCLKWESSDGVVRFAVKSFCLTVPNFVGQLVSVSLVSGFDKFYA